MDCYFTFLIKILLVMIHKFCKVNKSESIFTRVYDLERFMFNILKLRSRMDFE